MKGTIDITIKRKDGTVEKRQEHNIAFDLPALTIKEYLKNPALCIFEDTVLLGSMINNFMQMKLSEEESDLAKPSWRPSALYASNGGSASTYTAVGTILNEGKKRTVTAAWTMPSDEGFSLTLKSIQFVNNNNSFPEKYRSSSDGKGYGVCDGVLANNSKESSVCYKLDKSDFSFNNSFFGGLAVDQSFSNMQKICHPYRMNLTKEVGGVQQRTLDGRFGFAYQDQYPSYLYPSSSNSTIAIVDATTNQVILRFPVTQFTNFNSSNAYYTWVINTGTKNWLFQYDSSINASRIWQIPDTQTSAAIAPTSETFLQGIVLTPANQSSANNVGIVGNYIIANKKVYRVDDDLTVLAYKGYSDGSQISNGYNYYWKYMNVDYVAFEQSSSSPNQLSLSAANLTASNFSTPITLGAGDVLSVSYSISVGE